MARALLSDPSTKTLDISLNGKPAGVVTLVIKRKGHHHDHHASYTFGPRDRCGLPSVRVFDHCGNCGHCDACKPHVTPCHAGRVDVDECATDCHGGHHDPLGGCGHCGGHGCGHCHHEHHNPHEPSVVYTGAMTGCKATFTLDANIHDAPNGYYTADLFDGKAKLKTFTLVVRGSGLRANVTPPTKGC